MQRPAQMSSDHHDADGKLLAAKIMGRLGGIAGGRKGGKARAQDCPRASQRNRVNGSAGPRAETGDATRSKTVQPGQRRAQQEFFWADVIESFLEDLDLEPLLPSSRCNSRTC